MITPALLRKLQGHLIKAVAHGEEADLLARKAARAADHAVSEAAHVKGILGALARDLEGVEPDYEIEAALARYTGFIREAEEHAFNGRRLEAFESQNSADIARNILFALILGATS